jgi:hypothetical protein
MPPPTISRPPIVASRVRSPQGQTFAFLPHRFLRDGFFCSLCPDQLRLYVFLVLAADRDGISFYGFERICAVLEIDIDDFLLARDSLIRKDLIAFDGRRFQVLSLPDKPVHTPWPPLLTAAQMADDDPATVRKAILDSLADADRRSK